MTQLHIALHSHYLFLLWSINQLGKILKTKIIDYLRLEIDHILYRCRCKNILYIFYNVALCKSAFTKKLYSVVQYLKISSILQIEMRNHYDDCNWGIHYSLGSFISYLSRYNDKLLNIVEFLILLGADLRAFLQIYQNLCEIS